MENFDIFKLREETGAGIMDCKRALAEAAGDFEKARALIMAKGIAKAEKKADRQTGAGLLEAYIHNNRVGVLLELRCETDFVAHSEPVKELAKNLAMQIAAMAPESVEDLLKQPYIKDQDITVDILIKNTFVKVGENLKVAKFARYEI